MQLVRAIIVLPVGGRPFQSWSGQVNLRGSKLRICLFQIRQAYNRPDFGVTFCVLELLSPDKDRIFWLVFWIVLLINERAECAGSTAAFLEVLWFITVFWVLFFNVPWIPKRSISTRLFMLHGYLPERQPPGVGE